MRTVLVVDDSEFMQERLEDCLSNFSNLEVVGKAYNGEDGIAMYKDLKPDVVFLDINMPGCSGRDTLLQILSADKKAFVIMCSTIGCENMIKECIEYGAQYYLLKPFTKAKIEEIVRDVIDPACPA